MKLKLIIFKTLILPGILMVTGVFIGHAWAQEETTAFIRRYKQYEMSSGYYEQYEVKPRHEQAFVEIPGVRTGLFPYSPSGAAVRINTRLADSHRGIKFYDNRRCEECHMEQTRDLHTVRANLTCRQCHGKEPIASNEHYFSPMNPIRRHAYVCSKCHEGAGASYAAYVVHEPNPALATTQKSFPVLFYAFWIMIAIAVGTFAVFLPHTVLWGIRELFSRKEKTADGPHKK